MAQAAEAEQLGPPGPLTPRGTWMAASGVSALAWPQQLLDPSDVEPALEKVLSGAIPRLKLGQVLNGPNIGFAFSKPLLR